MVESDGMPNWRLEKEPVLFLQSLVIMYLTLWVTGEHLALWLRTPQEGPPCSVFMESVPKEKDGRVRVALTLLPFSAKPSATHSALA